MAIVTVKDSEGTRTLSETDEIETFLAQYGIWFRFFADGADMPDCATDQEILAAYSEPVESLKESGGYVTADVINITPNLEGLDAMLDRFNKEHWHNEDEVRFIVGGSGIFHLHPENGPVFSVEMFPGDMINVPKGMFHWFDLCQGRKIKAIRLFQDKSGWTPHYTHSEEERSFEPLCFGPSYFPKSEVS